MKRRAFLTMLGLAPVVASARPQRPDRVAAVDYSALGDELKPFIFNGSKLTINPAHINTITAGTLRSAPNRYGKSGFIISLDQGQMIIDNTVTHSIDVKAKSGFANWSRSV